MIKVVHSYSRGIKSERRIMNWKKKDEQKHGRPKFIAQRRETEKPCPSFEGLQQKLCGKRRLPVGR